MDRERSILGEGRHALKNLTGSDYCGSVCLKGALFRQECGRLAGLYPTNG